jgi:hypothetical protein
MVEGITVETIGQIMAVETAKRPIVPQKIKVLMVTLTPTLELPRSLTAKMALTLISTSVETMAP